MSSERRSIQGDLPDGVVPAGQEDNPNDPELLAQQRARFAERQRELQQDRQEASEQIRAVQSDLESQYERSMQDPEHQAFIQEQIAHEMHDPVHNPGGQQRVEGDYLLSRQPEEFDTTFHDALPVSPRAAEDEERSR
jgi:hypothetical protein